MSNANDREIEIQVSVENREPLLSLLKVKGSFIRKSAQIDEYFTPAHRNFVQVKPVLEWLRLREAEGVSTITYKNWHVNAEGVGTYCDEYESRVQSIDQMRKIFTALDLKKLITVSKRREVWRVASYEIAIDSVDGLGEFLEIEYKGEELVSDPDRVIDEMLQFLKTTGCGKITFYYNSGYAERLLFPDKEYTRDVV